MKTTETPVKTEKEIVPVAENKKDIENHKKTAAHLQESATHHLDAAKHHEEGNHEKAAKSTVAAQGHFALASETQKDDTKQHALNTKKS